MPGRKVDSTGPRNTSIRRCGMRRQPGWMTTVTGRAAMGSPGRPPAQASTPGRQRFLANGRRAAPGRRHGHAGLAGRTPIGADGLDVDRAAPSSSSSVDVLIAVPARRGTQIVQDDLFFPDRSARANASRSSSWPCAGSRSVCSTQPAVLWPDAARRATAESRAATAIWEVARSLIEYPTIRRDHTSLIAQR